MRVLAIITLLLLLAVPTIAVDTYYDAWLYPGETFTVDDVLYTVSKGDSHSRILLESGSEEYVLDWGECQRSHDGLDEYCFTESDYMDCLRGQYDCPDNEEESSDDWCCPYDVDHIKFEAGSPVFGAYVEFREVTPEIEVERIVDKAVLKLGEQTGVTIIFENTGVEAVAGAIYTETIPEGLKVLKTNEFQRASDGLELRFTINPGDTESFKYTIKPEDYVSANLEGNLTYLYRSESRQVIPDKTAINVPSPFLIEREFTPEPANIEDDVEFMYELTNNDGEFEMEAEVAFGGLHLLDIDELPDDVVVHGTEYTWSDTLQPDETVTLTFPFTAEFTGLYTIETNTSMDINGELFEHRVQDTLEVEATLLKPEIRVTSEELRSGQEYTVRLLLDNLEGETLYKRISAKLISPGLRKQYGLERIVAGEAPVVGELVLNAPRVVNETTLTYTFEGTYESVNREKFNFSETLTVDVIPVETPYLVIHRGNATSVSPGGTIAVTVTVRNKLDRYATIHVTENLPSGALVSAGSRENEMSLNEGEEREAYEYHVTVPGSYDSHEFVITTKVFDQQGGEFYEFDYILPVVGIPEPSEPVVEQNQTNETAPEPEPAPPPEEKPGFFRRVLDGIIGFFEKLFD